LPDHIAQLIHWRQIEDMEPHVRTGISYFGNRNPRHFLIDLEEILNHNCNFILHTFSENDQLFYKQTMAELIQLSKDAGLQVYVDPWGVGRIFGGEATSEFAFNHRDVCQVLSSGETAPAACMNNPRVHDFMRKWIDDAVEIGADVLFWDEPHLFIDWENIKADRLPRWACWCNHCKEKFQIRYGTAMPKTMGDDVQRFREATTVEFLAMLCDYAHERKVKNAVCLLPHHERKFGVTEWSRIAAIDSLDIFASDPYWMYFEKGIGEFVGEVSREIVTLASQCNKEAQVWIQNFRIPKGREDEIREAIAVAYAEGVRNLAAWSFYGTAYMSYIRSDDAQRVWDTLGEVYGQLVRGEWQ